MKKAWHQNFKRAKAPERTGADGFVYDSKTEMRRGAYLILMERAGEISNLQRQVIYPLEFSITGIRTIKIMAGKRVAIYKPDFVYTNINGDEVIEDVKGFRDEASKFRIRVFEALYDKKVVIVKAQGGAWKSE